MPSVFRRDLDQIADDDFGRFMEIIRKYRLGLANSERKRQYSSEEAGFNALSYSDEQFMKQFYADHGLPHRRFIREADQEDDSEDSNSNSNEQVVETTTPEIIVD